MPLDQSFRGLLSVHSRYGLHARQVAYATLYTGGSDGFVSFTAAPIATGWSEQFPGGTFTRSEPAPFTAHMTCKGLPEATSLVLYGKMRSDRGPHITFTSRPFVRILLRILRNIGTRLRRSQDLA